MIFDTFVGNNNCGYVMIVMLVDYVINLSYNDAVHLWLSGPGGCTTNVFPLATYVATNLILTEGEGMHPGCLVPKY